MSIRYCRHVKRLVLAVTLVACKGNRSESTPPPVVEAAPARLDASPAPAAPRRNVSVRVDRRVELVSIVQRLAGAPEYRKASTNIPYVAAVDAWFAPYKDHPAVRDAIEDRRHHGISFDAPMWLAIHLDDQLAPVNPDELPTLDPRFARIDVAQRAAKLRAFADEARLDEFLASQRTYLAGLERPLADLLAKEDPVAWFDGVFGPTSARFVVVPGPLTGTMNYGPHARRSDGTEERYQILQVGREGAIVVDDMLVGLLVHEMAHSYINPVFAKHRDALAAPARRVFERVARAMEAQNYKAPHVMVDESAVRAAVVMYMHDRKGAASGAAALRDEVNRSFTWTPEFVELLRELQRGETHDLDAFMPRVIAFWNGLAMPRGR